MSNTADPELKSIIMEHQGAVERNTKALEANGGGKGTPNGGDEAPTSMLGNVFKGISQGLKIFGAAIASAAAGLYTISKLVQTISPGSVELFNMAVKDLAATIGFALTPTLNVFTDIIRRIAGELLPLMTSLQPIFTELANIIGNQVVAQVTQLVTIIQSLMPVINILVSIFRLAAVAVQIQLSVMMAALAPVTAIFALLEPILKMLTDTLQIFLDITLLVIRVFSILVQSLVQVISNFTKNLIGIDFTDSIKKFGDALKKLAVDAVVFGVAVLRFLGMTKLADAFTGNLANAGAKSGEKSRQIDPQVESITSVVNKIALSAAAAQGTAGSKDPQLEMLDQINMGISKLPNTDNLEQIITKAIKNAASGATREVYNTSLDVGLNVLAPGFAEPVRALIGY